MATNTAPVRDPRVCIVIPVFKHSVFLTEAVDAAVAQVAPFEIAVLIVDDGCPFPETTVVGASYAMAHPNVFYLRKANGGLSSARNFGIEFALANFPDVRAVYFLDADNRITSTAIADAFGLLEAVPEVDWVYPNIDKFGAEWSGNYTAPYSKLLHLTFDNICEAGSLVSRRMLDAGCRFDETMKAGCEDWEFWLQGIAKGMRGINAPFFGFEYRLRGESMLSDTDREREVVLAYIAAKHKALFSFSNLIRLEHAESPRYALSDTAGDGVALFTDPGRPGEEIDSDTFFARMLAGTGEPDHYGVPRFLAWMPRAAVAELVRVGLAHSVLQLLEREIEHHHFIGIQLVASTAQYAIEYRLIDADHPLAPRPRGWFTTQSMIRECLADPAEDWVRSLKEPCPRPRIAEFVVHGPFDPNLEAAFARDPVDVLCDALRRAKDAGWSSGPLPRWNRREHYFPPQDGRYKLMRQRLGTGPLMPRIPPADRLQVGIALPITSFGGVEKVAYAVAGVLQRAGCDVHLFCFGRPQVILQKGQRHPFATTNFLMNGGYALWGGARSFMGHELRLESEPSALSGQVLGLLAGLDVVMNCHVAPLNAVMGRLRRQGTRVVGHLHVTDQTQFGRPVGHPYVSLGFEHAYDALLTCSRHLADWLHGMGVPRQKLVVIDNAPGYAIQPEMPAKIAAHRRRLSDDLPLRVVYLGRLDEQKGIGRLVAAIRMTLAEGLAIQWRVVGSGVIDASGRDRWTEQLHDLGIVLERPIFDSDRLTELYANADVFVLPSRWEGAPLSIIEAQRAGCVPIATDVGAVEELIDHGVDGFVIKAGHTEAIAREIVHYLRLLGTDRGRLHDMRANASARGGAADWDANVASFVDLLRGWFPDKLGA